MPLFYISIVSKNPMALIYNQNAKLGNSIIGKMDPCF
mgnify:CR=1 FL=1